MKKYYFSKSPFGGEYILDSGGYAKRRHIVGKEEDLVIHYFKKNLDKKRNSEIHVLKDSVSKDLLRNLCKFFSDSRVRIKLEDSFD